MATLNTAAHAARVEAARLRTDAQALKLSVRGNLARSRERLGKAQCEADRVRARRVEPMPSPWSPLRWIESYETLDQTLVPLP